MRGDFAGMDLGAGNMRAWSRMGGALLPSHVSALVGREYSANEALEVRERPMTIKFEGSAFYVGTGASGWGRPFDNLDDSRFTTGSPELRALLYGCLTRFNGHGETLNLLVGLPQSAWETDRAAPEPKVREWLVGDHQWIADGVEKSLVVEKVAVVSQPVGALYNYILDDDGTPSPGPVAECWGKQVAVISIGFSTLELNAVRLSSPPVVMPRFTESSTAGIRRLLRLTDPQGRYTLAELDEQLRADSAFVQPLLNTWAGEITGLIEKRWDDNWQRFAKIILIGGGTILLRDKLEEFFEGRAHFSPNPIFGVAQGLYRLGKARQNAQATSG